MFFFYPLPFQTDNLNLQKEGKKEEVLSLNYALSPLDVDAPQDLAASNIQTENAMLTWKAPRADITGYILSFESADGTIRVSIGLLEP